ncbi:hypothetical protein P167DRAFT_167014 [Morchella conica CCBAS932]|uniref:Uncharacterized protein n=1 Tax=Morchella conica CCBAS932 TaxID=1392247 RepID=A0A3N4KSA3_9PEZI|nr:hypothetical protein P167DRAFT_167014 [Morchella conica CCBAS932]
MERGYRSFVLGVFVPPFHAHSLFCHFVNGLLSGVLPHCVSFKRYFFSFLASMLCMRNDNELYIVSEQRARFPNLEINNKIKPREI